MKHFLLAMFGSLALAACGGGGTSAMIDACMKDGESREDCTCMAESLEKNLSPEAFNAMVLSAQGKDEEASEAMEKLGMSEGLAVAGAMLRVAADCGVTGFGN